MLLFFYTLDVVMRHANGLLLSEPGTHLMSTRYSGIFTFSYRNKTATVPVIKLYYGLFYSTTPESSSSSLIRGLQWPAAAVTWKK